MRVSLPVTVNTIARCAEDGLSLAVFTAMVLLALGEVAARTVGGRNIPGSIVLVQHLTLWVTLLGAALAARSDRLLAFKAVLARLVWQVDVGGRPVIRRSVLISPPPPTPQGRLPRSS